MAETFPKLIADTKPQAQKAQRSSRINTTKSITMLIIFQLQ